MAVLNQIDRFHLAQAAVRRLPEFSDKAAAFIAALDDKLAEHTAYVRSHGEDMPEIRDWTWPYGTAAEAGD
jgi:xylulose-5-phosphate/fructose-6-phosphate phosphoketolase